MALNLDNTYISPTQLKNIINNQSNKTVIPSINSQIITVDSGYVGLSQITVNPVPFNYVLPIGTITVTNAGIMDIKTYASINVPSISNPFWSTVSFSNNGTITYGGQINSGFNNVQQTFSNFYILPSINGINLDAGLTSQLAVNAYTWTKGSIILNSIPAPLPYFKKIFNKTITAAEVTVLLGIFNTVQTAQFMNISTISGSVEGSNVTGLGQYCFAQCSNITEINLPRLLWGGGYTWASCYKLSKVTLPSVSMLYANEFYMCRSLTNVSIPLVSIIYSSAFQNCSELSIISLPALTSISGRAFYNCSKLEKVYLLGNSVASAQTTTIFDNTPMSQSSYLGYFGSIYVPSSLLTQYQSARYWSTYSNRFVGV